MKKSTLVYSILTIIILFGYFLLIGSYPLLDVDETRYVEIARTMIKNHDFMTLYLNGVLFLTITLPWHILMLKTYPDLFFSEYIYKHHILRFLGSEIIHRNEPWYFYILTLLWGLMPHTFVLIGKLLNGIKLTKPNLENKYSKFLILNSIAFLVTLIFFSLSGAKLITYILPAYPFLAVIIAHIWSGYITKDNLKIKYALIGINSILILASLAVPFAASFTLGENAGNLHYMQVILSVLAYFLIINMIKNKRFRIFICQAVFTAALFGFTAPLGYKLDYSFGQDDLIAYAKLAKEHNYTISAYKTGKKYSLLYYSELPQIEFQNEDNIEWLNNELNKKENLVIIKNKDIPKLPENTAFKLAEKGVKYSIIEKLF